MGLFTLIQILFAAIEKTCMANYNLFVYNCWYYIAQAFYINTLILFIESRSEKLESAKRLHAVAECRLRKQAVER